MESVSSKERADGELTWGQGAITDHGQAEATGSWAGRERNVVYREKQERHK